MRKIDFTKLNGFPVTQNRLQELQDRDEEMKHALLVALGLDLSSTNPCIIQGLELIGSAYSDGWIVYMGNVFQVTGGVGNKLHFKETTYAVEFKDQTIKDVYTITTAEVNNDGTYSFFDMTTLPRLSNYSNLNFPNATLNTLGGVKFASVSEVFAGTDNTKAITPLGLSGKVASTSQRGMIEIATPLEVNAGSDNTRAITPFALKNTSYLANVLKRGSVYVANQGGSMFHQYISFPSISTSNYTILGTIRIANNLSLMVNNFSFTVSHKTPSSFLLKISGGSSSSQVTGMYFEYLIIKN